MLTPNEPYTILDRGWVVRIQPPEIPGSNRVLLMLHGWQGDENVMWIFARNLPKDYWILAPRGPVNAPAGGYAWALVTPESPGRYAEYTGVLPGLLDGVNRWLTDLGIPSGKLNLMGFSQGAAMCYTLLINQPDRVERIAALSGFIPPDGRAHILPGSLIDKPVFIAHGTRDATIPVELARNSAELLEAAGANVTYCEDDVGHKLGVACNKALPVFFK